MELHSVVRLSQERLKPILRRTRGSCRLVEAGAWREAGLPIACVGGPVPMSELVERGCSALESS